MAALLDRRGKRGVCRLYRRAPNSWRCCARIRRHPQGALSRAGSGKSGGVRVIYFTRTSKGEVVLLTLYAKANTDNITGAKLKEIRRALEE